MQDVDAIKADAHRIRKVRLKNTADEKSCKQYRKDVELAKQKKEREEAAKKEEQGFEEK